MERETTSMWEISFVAPSDHGVYPIYVACREYMSSYLFLFLSFFTFFRSIYLNGIHLFTETLDFNFLLKPRHGTSPCLVEEGSRRLLSGGNIMDRDAGSTALFRLPDTSEIVEFPVHVKADIVSPFALAGSWRAYKENMESQGSMVRGIPDVSIEALPLTSSLEV
jgi:hypothetical protein